MPIVTPVPIPPAPPAPQRNDPDTFEERNDAAVEYQFNTLPPALNQVADSAYQNALESQSFAQAATANGLAGANFKGQWADQTGAAAPPYAVFHGGLFWSLLKPIPDVVASQPGPINTDWAVVASPAQYNNFFVGDHIETARDPGPAWLRRDGGRYPVTAYPELAALMPKVPSDFIFGVEGDGPSGSASYGGLAFLGSWVIWGESTSSRAYIWDAEAAEWAEKGGAGQFTLGFGGVLGNRLVMGSSAGNAVYTEDLETFTLWPIAGTITTYAATSPTAVVIVGNSSGSNPTIRRATSIGGVLSTVSVPAGFVPREVFYAGGVFYVTPQSGTLCARSIDDGLTFTTFTPTELLSRVKEVGGKVFGLSQPIGSKDGLWLIEDNFSEYTKLPTNQTGAFYDIAYIDGKYVAVGSNGLEWSIDLASWNTVDDARLIGARIIFELDAALYTIAGGKTFRGTFVDSEIFFVPSDNPVNGWIKAAPDSTGSVGYAGIPEAPINDEVYARQGGAWRSAGAIFEASDTAVAAANTSVAAKNEAVPAAATAVSAANDAADTLDVIEGLVGDWPFKMNDLQTHIRNIEYGAGPYPSLDLLFTGADEIDPRINFTRSTPAGYWDQMGVWRTAAAGEPRFDYDPMTGECRGLLVEGQATNLIRWSEDYANAAWAKTDLDFSPGAVAPDGSSTSILIEDASGTTHRSISQQFTGAAGQVSCVSCYVKPGLSGLVSILLSENIGGSVNNGRAVFDLVNKTITNFQSENLINHGIQELPDGWFRIWLAATITNTETAQRVYIYPGQFNLSTPSSVTLWGVQVEQGSTPTSYIKTEASQATRAADQPVVTGGVFDSVFNKNEWTLFIQVENCDVSGTNNRYVVGLSDGTSANYAGILARSGYFRFAMPTGLGSTSTPVNGKNMLAIAYKADTVKVYVNGVLKDNLAMPPSLADAFDQLALGSLMHTNNFYNVRSVNFNRVSLYPRALPDAKLEELTTP